MSNEFDDIVQNFGERPDIDGIEDRIVQDKLDDPDWYAWLLNDEYTPTMLHQTMCRKTDLLEFAKAVGFDVMVAETGDGTHNEESLLLLTQLVFTGMSMNALVGNDYFFQGIINRLMPILNTPLVRNMSKNGAIMLTERHERLDHNKSLKEADNAE